MQAHKSSDGEEQEAPRRESGKAEAVQRTVQPLSATAFLVADMAARIFCLTIFWVVLILAILCSNSTLCAVLLYRRELAPCTIWLCAAFPQRSAVAASDRQNAAAIFIEGSEMSAYASPLLRPDAVELLYWGVSECLGWVASVSEQEDEHMQVRSCKFFAEQSCHWTRRWQH